MPLTEEEKVKVRHHLGYLNVAASSTFTLGAPAAVETTFIIEGAMNKVLDVALLEVRRQLQILDRIESQMVDDLELLAVQQVDEIAIQPEEMKKLRREYKHWQQSLANLFGVYPNPFDKRFGNNINARVNH